MSRERLQAQVDELALAGGVPGVAAGVVHGDREELGFHGVTSVEDPLPVDDRTLFQIASTGKTYTATAIACLAAQGRVDLDAPVREYVPELRLADERAAAAVTVEMLLNHTAGWDGGDEAPDMGEGDDALARYVATLDELPQRAAPGASMSYNNAAFALAGRVIERVTGQTYERALGELVLAPLGLEHTLLLPAEIMTHRFSASHVQQGGRPVVFRPWAAPRCVAGAGARTASTVPDQLAWARFHLGDGAPLMPPALLRRLHEPSAPFELFPGVRVGLAWWARDVDGVRIVEHRGVGAGQRASLTLVPEHDFAVSVLVNSSPDGEPVRRALVRWALETYVGLAEPEPQVLELDADELLPYVGTYGTAAMSVAVKARGGGLELGVEFRPGGGEPPTSERYVVRMVDTDRFVVVEGPVAGHAGCFLRDGEQVVALMHNARLAPRI